MKKLKRPRLLKSNFKVSERLRFQRASLYLIAVMVVLIAGPLGIWLRSTRVADYGSAVKRKTQLERIFATQQPGQVDQATPTEHFRALQEHFRLEEKIHSGLIEGTEKQLYLPAATAATPTAVAPTAVNDLGLIYFHGFMANRREMNPVFETVADNLNAPLFFSRVPFHGIAGNDLRDLSVKNYIEAIAEAEAVAPQIAKRVVLVGVSTGAPMAILLAADLDPELPAKNRPKPVLHDTTDAMDEGAPAVAPAPPMPVAGLVLISPNFGLPRWDWRLLTGPLGSLLGRVVLGGHFEWTPKSPDQAKFWIHRVHPQGLRAMAEIVQLGMRAGGERQDWSGVSVLLIQNPKDEVVDNEAAREYLQQFNFRALEIVEMTAEDHVLAGSIVSPQNNETLTKTVTEFIRKL